MTSSIERALTILALVGVGLVGFIAIMLIWFVCFPFRAIEFGLKRYISTPHP